MKDRQRGTERREGGREESQVFIKEKVTEGNSSERELTSFRRRATNLSPARLKRMALASVATAPMTNTESRINTS